MQAFAEVSTNNATGQQKPVRFTFGAFLVLLAMQVPGLCDFCGATSAPQWRKGTKQFPTLCNACGVRYKRTGTLVADHGTKARVRVHGA